MKKIDKIIIKILLKVCELLTLYSEKITTADIFSIKREIENIEGEEK